MDLYPNCSEFTIRLKADELTEEQLKEIEEAVDSLNEGDYIPNEWFTDEEEPNNEPWEVEIYSKRQNIFGMEILEISGNTGDFGTFFTNWLEKKGYQYQHGD